MAKWYKIPMTARVTQREYRANVNGINIVFGAVLGFVLAGAENLPPLDFATLLFVSAAVVILILYLGSTEYTLFYAMCAALSIAFFPYLFGDVVDLSQVPQLQPTLAVWAVMIVMVELLPREKSDPPREETDT